MRSTYLAGIGDANDPGTWSGIPFHLLQAGRKRGIIDRGLDLSTESRLWKARRVIWNGGRILKRRRPGGFQYSDYFLREIFAPYQAELVGSRMVNWFQLYPESLVENASVEKWFYIDMTLRQCFSFWDAPLDSRTMADAIRREANGYRSAKGILTLSDWAARSVIADYGIPQDRVHAIAPGANIDTEAYEEWFSTAQFRPITNDRPLRLVFTGKYWARKGLDRLIDAFRLALEAGAPLQLRVIGVHQNGVPKEYRDISSIEWIGFLDKRLSAKAFLNTVAECDVGCLLSRADASPIAIREYCALGLIAFCTNTGGSAEMAIPEASLLVPTNASVPEIAKHLCRLCSDRAATRQMQEVAWRNRREALWWTAVQKMQTIPGFTDHPHREPLAEPEPDPRGTRERGTP